jgi:hypothetical protein
MEDRAKGSGGVQERPSALITLRCHNRGGKAAGPS